MGHFPRQSYERTAGDRETPNIEFPRRHASGPPPWLHDSRQRRRRGTPWYAWILGGCLAIVVVLVLLCAILAGAIGGLIFHFAHRQDATITSTQTFAVSALPTLTADVDAGSVRVIAGKPGEVQVTVAKHATNASMDDARHQLQLITVDVRQVRNDIAVTARVPAPGDTGMSLAADVTLIVPQQSHIAIHLGAGDAHLEGVNASVTATITSGELNLTNVTLLDQSTLDVRDGAVTLTGTIGAAATAEVHIERGDATVSLTHGDPVSVNASTQRGDVALIGWDATPQRVGDGSSIAGVTRAQTLVPAAPPGSLFISVGAGNISIAVE